MADKLWGMRSSPLRRKTPLQRKAAPKRTEWKRKPRQKPDVPKSTREFVLRRDGGCRALAVWEHECWGGLVIHHLLPRSRGGGHDATNLAVLCSYSHQHTHGNPRWAKEVGLLR